MKTFGITHENKDNDVVADLSNTFEDIGHTPSCPNGLKPAQHADGRPMMCLPGRNQCSGNSLCYFNGVDFFCCPNAEDPYDEHVFGGTSLFKNSFLSLFFFRIIAVMSKMFDL